MINNFALGQYPSFGSLKIERNFLFINLILTNF